MKESAVIPVHWICHYTFCYMYLQDTRSAMAPEWPALAAASVCPEWPGSAAPPLLSERSPCSSLWSPDLKRHPRHASPCLDHECPRKENVPNKACFNTKPHCADICRITTVCNYSKYTAYHGFQNGNICASNMCIYT